MIPDAGSTCLFTFTTKFATLDGVYKVKAETLFEDAIASGISFVDLLYTPAGLSVSDFNTDFSSYRNTRIAVLESVTSNNIVLYVPEPVIATIPDPTIKGYYPLMMVVDLGAQENTQAILPLLDQVKDLVQSVLGTQEPVRVFTNSQNMIYLTDAEYQTLVTARQANIQTLVPLTVQIHTLKQENTYLAAKVAAYEAYIASVA